MSEDVSIAIVGAGFAGIGMAIRLKLAGRDDFLIFERAPRIGGVWRDNAYPGCACDVESHLYSFSFAPNPDWTRTFSGQPEIQAYLEACSDRFGLGLHLRLEHDVRGAIWDAQRGHWRIETSRGTFTARVLILGPGGLSEPWAPALPGLDRFEGRAFHSARWDQGCDLRGRRVAVIGTGASAIQIVPAIQPTVERLYLFQRTPAWIMPRHDRAIPPWVRRLFRAFPPARALIRSLLYVVRDLLALGFLHPKLMGPSRRLALWHLAGSVAEPKLRAALTPSYTIGCKRILLSDDYYPALTRPNVELVTAGIREIRARSIVDRTGVERGIDAIVFATGFRVTEVESAAHIRGSDGRTLAEHWAGSPKAYLGTAVAGFPNLFLLQGPNTGLGHTSVILMIESQIDHVLGALRFLTATGAAAIEPRPEVQAAFVAEIDARLADTVWNTGGCRSWYVDATGRNSTLWPGFTWSFRRRVRRFEPRDYLATPPRTAPTGGRSTALIDSGPSPRA